MNRKLHITRLLLLGCIVSTQASAQATAASGPKTRAEVKSETATAMKKGEITKSGEGGTLENAPPAVAKTAGKPKAARKTAPAASAM